MMNFIALSGLPRTGSTLLSCILGQNQNIHTEGNSAVCQLMWDMKISCENNATEQLQSNYRENYTKDLLISSIPKLYYDGIEKKYILDKCRSWTLPENLKMMKKYITKNPKIIVMTRPIDEIVESFVNLRKNSGWEGDLEEGLLDEGSEPIMRSLDGVNYAKSLNDPNHFLFIEYSNLVKDTKEVIDSIYSFCEIDDFAHNFSKIEKPYKENDLTYKLVGLHDIRGAISFRQ